MADEQITPETSPADETMAGEHHYSDTFTIPVIGEMTLPGGIYTFVFGVLAVLTALEVFTAEVFPNSGIKIAALLAAAIAKALLVMAFYMHLSRDNWLFRFVLGVPFFIVLASVLYLLGVPPEGYTLFGN